MIRAVALSLAICLPGALGAQQVQSVSRGDLRVLDKVTGRVTDVVMRVGEMQQVGLLSIQMNDCRVPSDNPSGNAYAELQVIYRDNVDPVFSGWMIASAPALNAMDHPRYDVWVIRCET
jgi:hypothetical protein